MRGKSHQTSRQLRQSGVLFSVLAPSSSSPLPSKQTGFHQDNPETGANKHTEKEEQEDRLSADTR